ncbi:unnamed protein product [Trichobilharzia regenti]|nr:unnamed protein product [Trichobilharzia regenti]
MGIRLNSNNTALDSNDGDNSESMAAWTSGKRICATGNGNTRNEALLQLVETLAISSSDEDKENVMMISDD